MARIDRADVVTIPDMFGKHENRTAVVVCKSEYSDAAYEIVAPGTGDSKYKDHKLSVELTNGDLANGSLKKNPTYIEPWRMRPIPTSKVRKLNITVSKAGMKKIARKFAAMCVGE